MKNLISKIKVLWVIIKTFILKYWGIVKVYSQKEWIVFGYPLAVFVVLVIIAKITIILLGLWVVIILNNTKDETRKSL